MKAMQPTKEQPQPNLFKKLAVMRIAFGIVWLIDAAFKFEPAFYHGILNTVTAADAGEPGWLNPWFHTWYRLIGNAPHLFAILIILIESLLAIALLTGIGRRATYVSGAIFSFLIWSVGEGFGGPYVAGSTDIGAGIIYVLVFGLLYVADTATTPAFSLVPMIRKLRVRNDRALKPDNFRKVEA